MKRFKYHDWIKNHEVELEERFFESLPPEDLPLDDDMSDYLDTHSDYFDIFVKKIFQHGDLK